VKRTILALACALSAALPAAASAHDGAPTTPNPVIQWNRTLLSILRTPGNQPATVHPTRSMALLHVAIYDAVSAIHGHGRPFLLRPSRAAAADAAAHRVLVSLYPGQQQALDDQYAALLERVRWPVRRQKGIAIGEAAAAQVLAARADDGSAATPPVYGPGSNPGDYQLTPPAFAPAVFTHWSRVTPFALRSADQFRPGPPPALAGREYARALNEVKALGDVNSTTRTADQTVQARFWAAPIQNYWNEIAQTAALAHRDTLVQDAQLFALLDVTLADSVIAFYDAKYAYHLWRPITAIREAGTDGNPATTADPAWTPLATTPPDPSYPGAHSVVSAAAATVLTRFFGGDADRFDVTSEVLPGVTRSFDRFSAAVDEAGLSRIYAGVHTRPDDVAGRALGRDVAQFDLQHAAPAGGLDR
jgi:hypothetical protein